VEGIRIRRSKRIRKSRKIWTQPLCGEFFFWVPCLSFEKNDYGSLFCMILDWMWLEEFSWGKKCVCDIKNRGGKCGSILYFDSCNGKLLKMYHIVLFYLEDVK
jgi:hypothetical protein